MPESDVPPIVGKPGYTTTEFWVTLIPVISSLLTVVFKKDFGLSTNAVAFATLAAGAAAAVYSISRAITKSATHGALGGVAAAKAIAGSPE